MKTPRIWSGWIGLIGLCWSVSLQAAGFDCSAKLSTVESMICADAQISALDDTLSEHYQQLLLALPSQNNQTVKRAQRKWLQQRNACDNRSCLLEHYQRRIDQLAQALFTARYQGKPMRVNDIFLQNYDQANAINVRFSVPVDAEQSWQDSFVVLHEGQPVSADDWLLADNGLKAVLPFVEAESHYQVMVKKGLKGINGQTLSSKRVKEFQTQAMQPFASFASQGYVLSPQLKMSLPVSTLNMDEVDLDVFHIPPDQLKQWGHLTHKNQLTYYALNDFSQKNPLVYSARFAIDHRKNQRTTTNLDLSTVDELQPSGAYLAVLKLPGQYDYDYPVTFFTVSDIGVQIRKHDQTLRVFVHSIASGDVKSDVLLEVYDSEALLQRRSVDANGMAELKNQGHTLIAKQGEQMTLIRFDRHPLDLSSFANVKTKHNLYQVYAWGPRDLYRPGETVETFALLKDFDGRAVADMGLTAQLTDATGSLVFTQTLNPTDSDSYEWAYTLPKQAKTGQWKIRYVLPGEDKPLHEYGFAVEEFLPERMSLRLFDDEQSYTHLFFPDQAVSIPVQGDYLYGAPAANNALDGEVFARIQHHPFEQWASYDFAVDGESLNDVRMRIDKTQLDGNGALQLNLPTQRWQEMTSPVALNASIRLYEDGGRPVTRSVHITKLNQDRLVGVEPQFKDHAQADSNPRFKFILTDEQGRLLKGRDYQVRVFKQDRNYYWRYDHSTGWGWDYDPVDYEIFSDSMQFDGKTPTEMAVPVEWGKYRIDVYDDQKQLKNRYHFSTNWSWYQEQNDQNQLKPDRVLMEWTAASYAPGETAQLTLTPPTDGLATVTVESGDAALWVQQIPVKASGTTVDVAIGKHWDRHDLYVTATVFSPGDMVHAVAPKRAFGLAHLPLQRQDARFDLTMDAPEKIEPNTTLKTTIELSNSEALRSQPVWVTLAAVDVGVLNITRFQSPDPAGYFFAPRRYDYTLYDVYGHMIENAGYPYVSQRFGGDASDIERGGKRPPNDVNIVSLQSQPVRFNDQGQAVVAMDIPDFNGTLRLMAVAWTDQRYAHAEHETKVVEKIVTQVSMPRFMAQGDASQVSLTLANQTENTQRLQIDVAVDQALKPQQWHQTLTLEPMQKQRLVFPMMAVDIGVGVIQASIQNRAKGEDKIRLHKRWTLGTRAAYPAVTRQVTSIIEPKNQWIPELIVDDLQSLQSQLMVSNQPPLRVGDHFDRLLKYPYGCTEQSTSSGYPWVLLDPEKAQKLGLTSIIQNTFQITYNNGFRQHQIDKALQKILPRQNHLGGFGLWQADARELPWLSVYATHFLLDAHQAKADVNEEALAKALQRLKTYFGEHHIIQPAWSDDPEYYQFATRAYAAYVLAKAGHANLTGLRRLSEHSAKVSKSGLPWAHLGFAFQMAGDEISAQKAFAKAKSQPYVEGYYGDYGSSLRDQALIYTVLAQSGQIELSRLQQLYDLVSNRQWLSTQERNALFQAAVITDEKLASKPFTAILNTRQGEQIIEAQQETSVVLSVQALSDLNSIQASTQKLYASLIVNGHYAAAPKPIANEVSIQRFVYDLDGQPITLSSLTTGEMVLVKLRIKSRIPMPDALVVDLLPAGLELENQNLNHASVDVTQVNIQGLSDDWQDDPAIEHMEYRDDRFVAAVNLKKDQALHLFYLARAVTPGHYVIPPPFAEDMYRPYYFAIGDTETHLIVKPAEKIDKISN